jgi:hypothetical protein
VNHAFYQVFGRDHRNAMRIDARMAALELSINRDWLRYKVSGYYASGDEDMNDGRATGFDSIADNAVFAGGPLSFWNRQEIRSIKQRFSVNPSMRPPRDPGESNFLNPGLLVTTAGIDAELTPRLRGSATASALWFGHTAVLEARTSRSSLRRSIGAEIGVGVTWRPLLNNNVVIAGGTAVLIPGAGLKSIYTTRALLSSFLELRFAY